jgi:hypothetical protein
MRERGKHAHRKRWILAVSEDVLSFDIHYSQGKLAKVRIKQVN